jgi:translocation and assembly module TamB
LLRDIQLRIVGDQNRLVVQRLEARDRGEGRISGSGAVQLEGTSPSSFDIALDVNQFRVLRNDLGTAQVSGNLAFAGDLTNARLGGNIRVDRADLRIPEVSGSGPPTIDVRVAGEEQPSADGSASGPALRIALQIDVEAPARVYVRGRGLESEWGGSLQVRGTADAPIVLGQIAARRGYIDLLGQRFTIDRGEIGFDGRQPPLPYVTVVTSTQGYEMKAIFTIKGPADDLEVELSSEPSYPQDEIISRLLFNRPAAQITPVQGLRVAAAVRQLQGGGDGFLGIARDTLGVDTLDVTGSSTQDAALSAGKYINDRVYLEVQQGITPESGKARVEVEITPNLSASTEVNEQAQTGVQLQWKWDY